MSTVDLSSALMFEHHSDSATLTANLYPRIRYMGSKYKLLPHLAKVFAEVGGQTALDAFSGSGVVSYLLKRQGFAVTANGMLEFPGVLASAAHSYCPQLGSSPAVFSPFPVTSAATTTADATCAFPCETTLSST